jgi:hypothetical protein
MSDARHHHVQIVFVGGSPKEGHRTKPGRYPHQPREHWTGPPKRTGKAEVLRRFLDRIAENDRLAREHMRPDLALLQARHA